MDIELLIKKWLNHELTAKEFESFKQLEDYQALSRLDNTLNTIQTPSFNAPKTLEHILSHSKRKLVWVQPLMKIAAAIILLFGLGFIYTTTLNTNINTHIAEKNSVLLPDQSRVMVNAKTTLAYNTYHWFRKRDVKLSGEAYFKVAKGSTFNVITPNGTISVLGTEFNVKQRQNYFEVVCFEGSVNVTYKNTSTILKQGEQFIVANNTLLNKPKTKTIQPPWVNGQSSFNSMPYELVLNEFERQYNVSFNRLLIDTSILFTGSFAHNDLELALKTITKPLRLNYSKNNQTITLVNE